MIQDLDGATSEPTRRGHVVVLSATMATVSIVLLATLVFAPPSRLGTAPPAASPAPSASAGPVMTIVSGPTMFFQSGTGMRLDVRRASECADGSWSDPPYYLVFDGNGQVIAAYSSGRTGRSVPTAPDAYVGTGWLTVSCATSDDFAPRIDRAR